MALRRVASGLMRPISQVADARISQYLCFTDTFGDKQKAMEEMYIKVRNFMHVCMYVWRVSLARHPAAHMA